jgi:hypothetical protein
MEQPRQLPRKSLQLTQAEIDAVSNELRLKGSLSELFGQPVFRRNLIVMVIIWSFCSFAFFLVPFYLATLDEKNMFLMSLALAIAEVLSSIICLTFVHGRDLKYMLSLFYLLTCIGALVIMCFDLIYHGDSQIPLAVGFLLLYVGVVTTFDLVYLIVLELFPTIYLATAYGACNIVGRAITILSPLVARAHGSIPLGVLAVYSLICIMLPFALVKVKKLN